MKLKFKTPAERKECHQHIEEAAREIEDSTPLLESLFVLENGVELDYPTGFGWVRLNEPDSDVVRLSGLDSDEFNTVIDRVENVSADDLGDAGDEQLVTIAESLSETAAILRERAVDESGSDQ